MKKSEAVHKLTVAYNIRHPMVEGGYITPQQFMEEMLDVTISLGLKPPAYNKSRKVPYWNGKPAGPEFKSVNEWEPE